MQKVVGVTRVERLLAHRVLTHVHAARLEFVPDDRSESCSVVLGWCTLGTSNADPGSRIGRVHIHLDHCGRELNAIFEPINNVKIHGS